MPPTDDDDDFWVREFLEPEARDIIRGFDMRTTVPEDQVLVLASIGISLKRIADRLDVAGELLGRAAAKSRVE